MTQIARDPGISCISVENDKARSRTKARQVSDKEQAITSDS